MCHWLYNRVMWTKGLKEDPCSCKPLLTKSTLLKGIIVATEVGLPYVFLPQFPSWEEIALPHGMRLMSSSTARPTGPWQAHNALLILDLFRTVSAQIGSFGWEILFGNIASLLHYPFFYTLYSPRFLPARNFYCTVDCRKSHCDGPAHRPGWSDCHGNCPLWNTR